jgi:hypothetical protein
MLEVLTGVYSCDGIRAYRFFTMRYSTPRLPPPSIGELKGLASGKGMGVVPIPEGTAIIATHPKGPRSFLK